MKILITCPNLKLLGGVANHYSGLQPFWNERVKYQQIGKRKNKSNSGKLWFIIDIIIYLKNLIIFRPNCILLNPSIGSTALRRDFFLQKLANIFGFKTALFIHGFDNLIFDKLNNDWLRNNFNKSSILFVLAAEFKYKLESIGVTTPIELSSTKVDDRLIEGFEINEIKNKKDELLFLSRVERAKGIYETIECFKILKIDYPELKLRIAGDGSELNNIKKKIEIEGIEDVILEGRINGSDVARAYKSSSILLLISTHGEGMPTTVLEAMAFGLPIITRPVGGLVDFFENGKMGVMDETTDPKTIAAEIKPYLDNHQLKIQTGIYNHNYSVEHFMASKVAKNIEKKLREYILS